MHLPKIIWENDHLVAVEKPSGWLSVPSRMGLADERAVVGIWLQEFLKKQIYPLHRLDVEVSGLMLFAKSADAHRVVSASWERHEWEKIYVAWTPVGPDLPGPFPMQWEDKLAKGKKRAFTAAHGKETLTQVLRLDVDATRLKWHLWPVTGRAHQLRFALASRGYPILGDKLYGSTEPWFVPGGIGLRAFSLRYANAALDKWLGWPERTLKIGQDCAR